MSTNYIALPSNTTLLSKYQTPSVEFRSKSTLNLKTKKPFTLPSLSLDKSCIYKRSAMNNIIQRRYTKLHKINRSLYNEDNTSSYTFEEIITEKLEKDIEDLKKIKIDAINLKNHPIFSSPLNELKRFNLPFPQIRRSESILRDRRRKISIDYNYNNRKDNSSASLDKVKLEKLEAMKPGRSSKGNRRSLAFY